MKQKTFVRLRDGLLSLVVLMSAWQAQAMDCAKASAPAERLVCASPALQAQDLRLNDVFKVAAVVAADPTALRDEQRRWVGARNACADEGCVARAYAERITALERLAPVKDVWVRTMPGQFRDGWLFFARGGRQGRLSAGEPVWVINTEHLHSLPPAAAGPQWFDRPRQARNLSPYAGKRGTRVRVFGFFSGLETTGVVDAVTPTSLVITGPEGTLDLARTPRSLTVTASAKYPLNGKSNPLLLYLQSGCDPLSHVVDVRVPDRAAPPSAWYGVAEERGPSDREGLCGVDRVKFRYDELFGMETGLSWGDSGAHVLADGSFLLVSSLWESVHVARIRADGGVPVGQADRIRRVDWPRLESLRDAALKFCESQTQKESMDAHEFAQCLVDQIEQGI